MRFGTLSLAFTILSVIRLVQGASRMSYTFPYRASSFYDIPSYQYYSVYRLGTLSAGCSITITLTIPQVGATLEILDLVSNLVLLFLDETSSPAILKYALQADGSDFIFPSPTTRAPTYSATYPIYFPPNSGITSAPFSLVLCDNDDPGDVPPYNDINIDYFNVEVTYFNSTLGQFPSKSNIISTPLRATDLMRNDILKIFYVKTANSVFNFSVFPYDVLRIDGTPADYPAVYLYSLEVDSKEGLIGNQWMVDFVYNGNEIPTEESKQPGSPVFINNVAHYSYQFPTTGFYFVEVIYDNYVDITATVTFETDPYVCPYSPAYPDIYLNFQGCTHPVSDNGLPCVIYDHVTEICSLCIQGYSLINGSCLVNTTCPPRQYFHFGSCYNVSSTCGGFDIFTGACLNCNDSLNFDLLDGRCLRKNVTCASNQWQANSTCFNASSACATFDPNSGKCLTCLSELYHLSSNGECNVIVVNCSQGQYANGLACVSIPAECQNFDKALGKCLTCIQGFTSIRGICQRIGCPDGFVRSKIGIFCVMVSPLCYSYDQNTGECLSCKDNGYTVRNGRCVQIVSPLAGCLQRQKLGFGSCIEPNLNCKVFNLIIGNCDQCNYGYYIDYTGHCSLNAVCSRFQQSVNGQCIGFPDNCVQVDGLGLCTRCVDDNYRIQLGGCVHFPTCGAHQYLNSGGQCVEVSPDCAAWNPTNGDCITCRIAVTQPFQGVCCPIGQINRSGACVQAASVDESKAFDGSACLTLHPSLKFCLSCPPGHIPDYTILGRCIEN